MSIASSEARSSDRLDSDESRQLTLIVTRDLDGRHTVRYAGIVVDHDSAENLADNAAAVILDHLTRRLRPTH